MEKRNKDKYPGYPPYPAKEDITQPNNNNGKASLDADNGRAQPFNDTMDDRDEEVRMVAGTDADVTNEDLRLLEITDQNMDTRDASNLIHSSLDSVDDDGDPLNEEDSFNGQDLDVPGSEDDDDNEAIGEEDEENNFYSLGGDNHENQEENKGE
jgi:hypothetical protein